MSALSEALGFESLLCLGRELSVGPFSADLLAEDIQGNKVLIENQLEQTDHDHLGKCLTYAAGLEARTVIWITAQVRQEHRAAIDWLNEISTDEYSFFAVEIELMRIGESPLAPRFNVVASPNDWSRSFKRQAKRAEGELTEAQAAHREYWTKFIQVGGNVYPELANRVPFKGNWQTAETRSVNSELNLQVNAGRTQKYLRAEIYFAGPLAKAGFDYVRAIDENEDLFPGREIVWERKDGKQDSRIAAYYSGERSETVEGADAEMLWVAQVMSEFATVIKNIVHHLKADSSLLEVYSESDEV